MYQEDMGGRFPAMSELRGKMKIISFITEASVVRQILEYLNLWEERLYRDPPEWEELYKNSVVVREPLDDGWGHYDEYNTPSYSA